MNKPNVYTASLAYKYGRYVGRAETYANLRRQECRISDKWNVYHEAYVNAHKKAEKAARKLKNSPVPVSEEQWLAISDQQFTDAIQRLFEKRYNLRITDINCEAITADFKMLDAYTHLATGINQYNYTNI